MPIKPDLLVRGADGRPQPPADLLARIRRNDPRIGLFYTSASWAITEAWKDDDPRRQWVRDGSMQPEFAFNVIGSLPITCALDEAPAYIERELRSYAASEHTALREAVRRWNDEPNTGQDAATKDALLSAVSNDLDRGGPSIGVTPVALELSSGTTGASDPSRESMAQRMARVRAAKQAKTLAG